MDKDKKIITLIEKTIKEAFLYNKTKTIYNVKFSTTNSQKLLNRNYYNCFKYSYTICFNMCDTCNCIVNTTLTR